MRQSTLISIDRRTCSLCMVKAYSWLRSYKYIFCDRECFEKAIKGGLLKPKDIWKQINNFEEE